MNLLLCELLFGEFSWDPCALTYAQNHHTEEKDYFPLKVLRVCTEERAEEVDREATSYLGTTCWVLGA